MGTVTKRVFRIAEFYFQDVGVSHTFTFKLPGTVEELEAAMLAAGEAEAFVKANAAKILNNNEEVWFEISNVSTQRGGSGNGNSQEPIILKKLEFGFDK